VITRDRIVIDGYARWELAKRLGRRMLDCIEYELSREEALRELIRTHCSLRGLTDFVRIELALELELTQPPKTGPSRMLIGAFGPRNSMKIEQIRP
jgi:hypothetical protein